MKILLVTTDAYGCNGGIAQYNRDLVESLASMPATQLVTVLARNLHTSLPPLPDRVRFVPAATHGTAAFLWACFQEGLARQDLVICGHLNLLPVAAALAARSACPLVLMVYGIEVCARPANPLTHWLANRADAVWSISDYTRRRMASWLSVPDERYALLPNAIRLEHYGMAEVAPEVAHRYRGNATHVLLTLGRLAASERYKGIDEILDALPALLERYPHLRYVVAGDGDDRPRLEQKAHDLGISEHVLFTGFVREEEKADLYRLADVFAMPGRGEGFGFVFLEAMACGTPVVASTLDGSYEAIRNGQLGLAADPTDKHSIVTSLLKALEKKRSIPTGLSYFKYEEFRRRVETALNGLVRPSR